MKQSDETPPGDTSKDEAGGRETPSGVPEPSSFYDLVGREAGLARLVDRFYEIMDTEPAAAGIRAMHRGDLAPIREKLFAFLSGWLGGPRFYTGCVVGAHRQFQIGEDERDQWLTCMRRALTESALDPAARKLLEQPLFAIADFMRTR